MSHISAITLLVPEYDDGIAFYVGKLTFTLVEDTPLGPTKRWVLVAPPGARETRLLLARADGPEQVRQIGHQAGGRVVLFLSTSNFDADHAAMLARGVEFLEAPRTQAYGKVAVFRDPFGNKWDLIGA